jgi:hypothetical protein
MYTHSPRKPELFPTTKKTPQNTQFSDVIAIKGNQWHLQTVSVKKLPEICAKKSDQQKPAKLTGFFLIKTRISANNPIIAIYSTGVDALPLEPENPIRKQAIGARIGLKIMHLMEQGNYPVPGFV